MADMGIRPFPMVYGERKRGLPCDGVTGLEDKTLAQFQRWAVRPLYTVASFAEYDTGARSRSG